MAAPTGNANALKHGLYARHLSKAERTNLKWMDAQDLEHEITLLRAVTDRILRLLEQTEDAETKIKLLNALNNTIATINTSARTHALLNGSYNPLDDALTEALANLDPYA
jgi:uncharacterized protein YjcR